MLALQLQLADDEVRVQADGSESHSFPLSELNLSQPEAESFFDDPSAYGGRLFRALFKPGSPAEQALAGLPRGARLVLRMVHPTLASFPWEYLHDGETWLAARWALIRAGLGKPAPAPGSAHRGKGEAPAEKRLKLLFVAADPPMQGDQPAPYYLGVDAEWDDLKDILTRLDPACDLVRVRPPSIEALHQELAGVKDGIVHFTGHGTYDVEKQRASLIFEKRNGASDEVPAGEVCLRLQGHAGLAVLSACLSALPGEGTQANLAGELARQGVPFVLGMQVKVADAAARTFTTEFYRHLFAGEDPPEAVRQARLALLGEPAWIGAAVLYAADPQAEGRLAGGERGCRIQEGLPKLELKDIRFTEHGFFGRQRELVQAGTWLTAERLRQGEVYPPLTITLHGPGGIGKTALLRRAAERYAWAFPDGVLGLSLETAAPEKAAIEIERFFGLKERRELEAEERLKEAAEGLKGKRALLALDNFETLLYAQEGGDEALKRQAEQLLRFFHSLPARGAVLLISSRELTNLPGEQRVPVPGLDEASGAKLFKSKVQRRQGDLDEKSLREISGKVGGHPLALILLGPAYDDYPGALKDFTQDLERILPQAAAPEWDENRRHATLRACFAFSLDRLSGKDAVLQEAAARLSLFRGAFPAFIAQPVLYGLAEEAERARRLGETERTLRRLHERGLLEWEHLPLDEHRALDFYHMHPALRPFAAERLGEAGRQAAEAGYFAALYALAGRAFPHQEGDKWAGIYSSDELAEISRRLLADLRQAAGMKDDADASLLGYRTAFLFSHFGELEPALALYRQSLEIHERLGNQQGKAATLHEMAGIFVTRGELEPALALYRQSLEIHERLGNLRGKAATLHQMAGIFVTRGELEPALALYRQSLEIDERLGNQQGKAATLHEIARVLVTRGELEPALALYRQSLEIKERLGDQQGKAATLHEMAGIFVTRGELEPALALYRQSLEIKERLGDQQGKAATLHEIARVLVTRGELEPALALYRQSLEIHERLGDLRGKAATLHEIARVLVTRGELEPALALYRQSLEIKERLGDQQGKAATLHEIARVLVTRGELEPALALYRQSLEIKERLGDQQGKAATLHEIARVLVTRGELEPALALYRQSLEIKERLGDQQGKAATLHQMAGIFVTRGELEPALALYRQSLEIHERLGDQQGKAATLAMLGQVLTQKKEEEEGLRALLTSLQILQKIGAQPDAQTVAGIIASVRQSIGAESFNALWEKITGGSPPDWLRQD